MSHYDEVNRKQRAGEDQAERFYERSQDALRQIRIAAAACADAGEPMWGIQDSMGYIYAHSLTHTQKQAWKNCFPITYSDESERTEEGFTAVQITAENAKRIEDFSDGSVPTEKWVQRDDGGWEVVPL